MDRYPALIEHDEETGLYGVVFPDLTGTVAMGKTVDEAMRNAEAALRDCVEIAIERGWDVPPPSPFWEVEVPAGNQLVAIALILPSPETVRANLYLEADVLAFIDGEAKRRNMTRKSYVTWMARRVAAMGG